MNRNLIFGSGVKEFSIMTKDEFAATNTGELLSGMLTNHETTRSHAVTGAKETGHLSLFITQNGEVWKVDVSSVLETKLTRQSNLNDEVESNA